MDAPYVANCHRWKIERLFAWIQNYRRLVTRYEYYLETFTGVLHLACAFILLRHLEMGSGGTQVSGDIEISAPLEVEVLAVQSTPEPATWLLMGRTTDLCGVAGRPLQADADSPVDFHSGFFSKSPRGRSLEGPSDPKAPSEPRPIRRFARD